MKSRHYDMNPPDAVLAQELEHMKQEDVQLQPSPALQDKLLQSFRTSGMRGVATNRFFYRAAAVILISLFCGSLWILKPESRKDFRPQTNTNDSNGYMPITYGITPQESLQRVRVKLPRSALNDFGISVKTIRTDEVTADLLVGESGLPYAIRVVQKN